ncbi:ABC transporter permease [Aeromicrobium halocynthiae]|uniref:ABC transporter permease n=1 Tax=Aeromicrobium halocynthiae TaxID=560557 RepID=A0ABN2VQJ1_9ACTN
MTTPALKASTGRGRALVAVAGALTALTAWYLLSQGSENVYFPALSAILEETVEYWQTAQGVRNLTASLKTLSAGLLIGVASGVGVGLLIGQLPILEQAVSPALEFARAIPATALIPFAMMLFGVGDNMKIFLIALGSLWPVLLNTADGARRIDPTLEDSARAFRITGFQRQVFIVLPAVLPRVLVGIRIAIPLGLILMVTSEMVGAQQGLGFVITQAQATFQLVTMWSGIVVLGLLGFTLTLAYSLLERALLRWSDPRKEDA